MNDKGLTQYKEYLDSNIEWLGDVPKEWAVVRLKDLGFLQNGISRSGDYFGSGFPFISYGNVYNNTISATKIKTFANSTPEDQQAYSCKNGDVFFTRTSETIEEIGFSATCLKTIPKTVFSGFVIRFRPTTNGLVAGFSRFYFTAKILRRFFGSEISLVTRASLSQGLLNKLSVVLPPLPEQKKIADYLSTKTAQIDKEVHFLAQKAVHYDKLKHALINETVTHGLDKTVDMRDSDIEWIGEIPKHWEVKRIKDIAKSTNGGAFKHDLVDVGLPIIKIQQLTLRSVAKDFCNPHSHKIKNNNKLESGDLVFSWSTLIAPFIYNGESAVLNQHIFKITHSDRINKKWIYYKLLQSTDRLKVFAHGSTMQHILKSDFDNLEIETPPLSEQIEIAIYLDNKTKHIESIVNTINTKVKKLKELRSSIINDAVTGKIKVTLDEKEAA